jgi:hypothetical protein
MVGMKNKAKWLLGIVLVLPGILGAQSFTETALMFSRINPGGSARIQAMGGVQTSLGGDYSSAFSNPAGLGMFNRSEFSISPGFNSASIQSDYLGNSTSTTKTNLHIPGFGLVFQNNHNRSKGFLSGAFAITFNRVNNFNQGFNYQGTNSNNSIIDFFIEDATGLNPDSFLQNGNNFNTPTGLAYNNYLIEDSTFVNPNASRLDYLSVMGTFPSNPNDIRTALQMEEVINNGAQNQWNLSYGANLSDKIFVGAGIGFASLRYQSKKTYSESDYNFVLDPAFNPLDNLVLVEELDIRGAGINGTLGLIARPLDIVQVGISYTSPTLYKITDTYRASMNTLWNNFDYFGDGDLLRDVREESDEVISEYDLRTPGRLNLGASIFFEKFGFLSADVEMVNYSGANYSAGISGISFDSDNESINELYQNTFNYRLGGEFRYNNYRARAGFAYMPDPFKSQQNGVNRQITSFSGGIGYRTKSFYLDAAVVFTQGKSSYRPYNINSAESPLVMLKNKTTFGMLTIGFPF